MTWIILQNAINFCIHIHVHTSRNISCPTESELRKPIVKMIYDKQSKQLLVLSGKEWRFIGIEDSTGELKELSLHFDHHLCWPATLNILMVCHYVQ